ncbi:Peptidyl-prolyl cis-trans isomerase,FKBP-type,domain [Ostreococcus tauri]|uniref:peptidylprolyl isomerase n=2 Tax=Ostreococcus tauri TaxID=70448 RepID=A0A090M867_OSTTA|nr:Peptidyl-prolyl cis-trans isomerase,FKBP-type,domain [Ostreococcus tauri]CEF98887.1 Peptidyl-prolyl cis-trans isomerase,FKBP-type,domain [Ostreococcus tauri]|eukprot:XP_003080565.2 Peptidyl-prolyl cis-trans isomerase,FKBP-type,domain [Ostreococcus tauri]
MSSVAPARDSPAHGNAARAPGGEAATTTTVAVMSASVARASVVDVARGRGRARRMARARTTVTAARAGERVTLHYSMTLGDGTVVDDTRGEARGGRPVIVTVGDGALFPKISKEIESMAIGDARTVRLAAEEAFGARDPGKVQRFPLSPEEAKALGERARPGQLVELPDGGRALVLELDDAGVALDLNHPLAGQDLTFEIELLDISEGATIFGVPMVNFTPGST